MMTPTYTIVQPDYLARFHCIGASCDAACCRNWLICIDPETYRTYRRLRDGAFVRKAARCLQPVESGGAYIRLGSDGRCPFLCPDKLCYIQRRWGASHLSETCRKYPRYLREIDGVYEYSLNLSCPLAARLTLQTDAPLTWVETQAAALPCAVDSTLDTSALRSDFPMIAHFRAIRSFVLQLLGQSSAYPESRLARLNELARHLDALAGGAESEVPACLAALRAQPLAEPPPSSFAASLARQRAIFAAIRDDGDASVLAPYATCLAEDASVLRRRWRESECSYAAFVQRREHLWGNFLASEAFRAGLPFYGAGATFTQRCRLFAALYHDFPRFLLLQQLPADDVGACERFALLISALLRATASDELIRRLTDELAE